MPRRWEANSRKAEIPSMTVLASPFTKSGNCVLLAGNNFDTGDPHPRTKTGITAHSPSNMTIFKLSISNPNPQIRPANRVGSKNARSYARVQKLMYNPGMTKAGPNGSCQLFDIVEKKRAWPCVLSFAPEDRTRRPSG